MEVAVANVSVLDRIRQVDECVHELLALCARGYLVEFVEKDDRVHALRCRQSLRESPGHRPLVRVAVSQQTARVRRAAEGHEAKGSSHALSERALHKGRLSDAGAAL